MSPPAMMMVTRRRLLKQNRRKRDDSENSGGNYKLIDREKLTNYCWDCWKRDVTRGDDGCPTTVWITKYIKGFKDLSDKENDGAEKKGERRQSAVFTPSLQEREGQR